MFTTYKNIFYIISMFNTKAYIYIGSLLIVFKWFVYFDIIYYS